MPKQGPGTKLVLRGLARAFPEIAAQRAREEQEERDQLQFTQRKQTARRDGGEDRRGADSTRSQVGFGEDSRSHTKGRGRHGSSMHSRAAGDFESGEDESVGRGPSRRANSRDQGYHSQYRDHSRVESVRREPSMHTDYRDYGYHSPSRGHSRVESVRREPSMHTDYRDHGYHSPSRDHSRVVSIRAEPQPSRHSINSKDAGYHGQSRGHSRVESLRREPSMHSHSKSNHHPGGQSQSTAHSRAIFIPQAHSKASAPSSSSSTRRSTKSRAGNLSVVEEIPIRTR